MNARTEHDWHYAGLVAAANSKARVSGLTHGFYRYPARFGEGFVREAILSFSKAGDLVIDPFCGGGTTVVEALATGRRALGTDLSKLAVLITKVKSTPISSQQMAHLSEWVDRTTERVAPLLLCNPRSLDSRLDGVPANYRNLFANLTERLSQVPRGASRDFIRCLLLRVSQWALDSRQVIPTPTEFLSQMQSSFCEMTLGMQELISSCGAYGREKHRVTRNRVLSTGKAADISRVAKGMPLVGDSLVITSPPYLGVHVLYNRWQLTGRKELSAPFFLADCADLGAPSAYTIIPRHSARVDEYFEAIRASFAAVASIVNPKTHVIQLVAFADIEAALPRYLQTMREAGLQLCDQYAPLAELHTRPVPSRRWYARVGASPNSSSNTEVLLIHRKGKSQ